MHTILPFRELRISWNASVDNLGILLNLCAEMMT
jgi:hypothetical protein